MNLFKKLTVNYDKLSTKFVDKREQAIFKAGIEAGRHESGYDGAIKTLMQGLFMAGCYMVAEYVYRKTFSNTDTETLLEEYYDEDI